MEFREVNRSNHFIRWTAIVFIILSPSFTAAQGIAPLQLQFVNENDQAIEGVEINLGSFVYTGNSGRSFGLTNLKSVDKGIANVVVVPGPTFLIQLEGLRFDEGRVWKQIDMDARPQRPIKVGRPPK